MLNRNNERELAYVVVVDDIQPIEGKDRVECAVIGGWKVMVRKGQFKQWDPGIYFEIDSKVPETEPFEFLASKHYKVKTQKYGDFYSQGLLMSAEDFGWITQDNGTILIPEDGEHSPYDESRFLTSRLGVTYANADDNVRKAKSPDKYKKMAARHPELFKKPTFRWLMKREWGKRLLFLFYGKKRDRLGWPNWVKKTDEDRIQNVPWILATEEEWVATEKIDGSSATYTLRRKPFGGYEFIVCSRNVAFGKDGKGKCFYETNVYTEIAEKYGLEEVLTRMLEARPTAQWITVQGEIYGDGIQRRDYSIKSHKFAAFNLIYSDTGRLGTLQMATFLRHTGIPTVPILGITALPSDVDAVLAIAQGDSELDGKMREGIVFRSLDGRRSFKAVSNEYLMKYHS